MLDSPQASTKARAFPHLAIDLANRVQYSVSSGHLLGEYGLNVDPSALAGLPQPLFRLGGHRFATPGARRCNDVHLHKIRLLSCSSVHGIRGTRLNKIVDPVSHLNSLPSRSTNVRCNALSTRAQKSSES